jgi:CopG family transcriptional regulator, nickel-responsive regulator
MDKVTRFGVSLDTDLLKKFDTVLKEEGYASRSEALRDLIREKLVGQECNNPEEEVVGTLTILYNHDAPGLVLQLMDMQHHSDAHVTATTHIHLDNHFCVEVIFVRGKAKDVRDLTDSAKALKGVDYGKLVLTKSV